MHFLSNEIFTFTSQSQLETLHFNGDSFIDFPTVEHGIVYHFTLKDSIMNWIDDDYRFNLKFHTKHSIFGEFNSLKEKLNEFHEEILKHKDVLHNETDQFSYIFNFIIFNNEKHSYELILSSDTFDLSKFLDIKKGA